MSSWETLTEYEKRSHPKYKEGYKLFKGKPKTFSFYNPYRKLETLEGASNATAWNCGANAALEEDRGHNVSWKIHYGPPIYEDPSPQLDLFGD